MQRDSQPDLDADRASLPPGYPSAWEHDVMLFATETLTEVRREERG